MLGMEKRLPASQQVHPIAQSIIAWQQQHGRHHLPWQQNVTPYRVWVSEIMLQQTQVETVIPYFQRFMARFPTIQALAEAPLDDVMALWSGLGYYARARRLHVAAQCIVEQHQGQFPRTLEDVMALPGIGESTAGAILSFTHQGAHPILDGNVKRVLARLYALSDPIDKASTVKKLWDLASMLTPQQQTSAYNQGIMDLGATICTPTSPSCTACPIKQPCLAYKGDPTQFPVKTVKKIIKPRKQWHLLIIKNQDAVYLEKRPMQGIWGGLWSFPIREKPEELQALLKTICSEASTLTPWPTYHHELTHLKLALHPLLTEISSTNCTKSKNWYTVAEAVRLGLSQPVSVLLERVFV